MRGRSAVVLLSVLLATGCRGGGPAGAVLPIPPADPLLAIPSTPPLDGAQWGVLFLDVETGSVLHAVNATRRFIPASNRKIPVAAAALSLLGPDYGWETAFHSGGAVSAGGVVDGDLILVSRGDPTLGPPFHGSGEAALDGLAANLVAAGVRQVDGDLVVDAAGWDSTAVPVSWMVEDLEGVFGASGGAFAVDVGVLTLTIQGGAAEGDTAAVAWEPMGDSLYVENRVATRSGETRRRLRGIHLPESGRIRLEGDIAPGETRTLRIASREVVPEAARVMERALLRQGIRIMGNVRIAWTDEDPALRPCAPPGPSPGPATPENGDPAPRRGCPGLARLAGLASPPLSRIAAAMLGPSQNWISEQILRTLGGELGAGPTWAEGMRVERNWLVRSAGVDTMDVTQRDGSGMSAQNLITPRAVVQILEEMARSPHFEVFRSALPEPGEEGTTLESRLRELDGRVHAKTGSLTHVTTLSGYLVTDRGRLLAFSILTNASGVAGSSMRDAIDRMVLEAARRW